MAQKQIPTSLKRILKVTLVLIAISAMSAFGIGIAAGQMNNDVKRLKMFMVNAESSQPNFEKSLEMYTGETKDIIGFLLSLRPANEQEYVKFIAEVEEVGQKYSRDLKLRSIEKSAKDQGIGPNKTLDFAIDYYGHIGDLKKFIKELEAMSYFLDINSINFRDPKYIEEETTNISIKIKLFVK